MDELDYTSLDELLDQAAHDEAAQTDKHMEELLALAEHDPEAQFQLGTIYNSFTFYCMDRRYQVTPEEAFGKTAPDTAKEARPSKTREELAEAWLRKAAEGGHVEAMFQLGELHAKWQGHRLLSGELYKEGRYSTSLASEEDREQAKEWYRKAAERGHVEAMFWLGELYRPGERWPFVTASWPSAAEWFQKAAEQGHVLAMVRLGEYHSISCGSVDKESPYWFDDSMFQSWAFDHQEKKADPEQAFYWYRKAAEQGDPTAIEALKELGIDEYRYY